ncbi:hypothetical protein DRO53_04955 [Candidatus Bathyarchaeota archaeon]|nr:MAG: hypothetical protein DRO53_04955 [Candidatus Bathyarchaeota archaeon]
MEALEEATLASHAKYPFTKKASEYLKQIGFDIEDFSDPSLSVLERARKRIMASAQPLKDVPPPAIPEGKELEELLSFPLALYLAKATGDQYLWRRLALYEARVARARLLEEPPERLVQLARENFGWEISLENRGQPPFKLHFSDYLRNASRFREDEWKLVNQRLREGYVFLTKEKVARLLEEEIRGNIQARLERAPEVEPPEPLKSLVEDLKAYFSGVRKVLSQEELGSLRLEAFPPCISKLYFDLSAGKDLPHIGRFTLTAFLINVGMKLEEIIKLYTSVTDFDEKMTKYQVEHIAGLVGGKTRYRPLGCSRMKTHGLCPGEDDLCKKVRSPLAYYRLKLRRLRKAGREEVPGGGS